VADLVYPPVIAVIKTFWKVLGLRFDFSGEENIPRKDGAILAINHVSYLDFAITGTAALPANRYVRFMAKKEIFENKLAGPLMRGMHHISVDRSSGSASFVAALRALKAGEIIGIFPEGTTSTSFEIKDLKHNKFPVTVVFGKPIFYERGTDVEQAELHLRTTLLAMLRQVQEDYPDSHVGQRWAPVRLGGTAPAPLN